jgi:hypothetical protein
MYDLISIAAMIACIIAWSDTKGHTVFAKCSICTAAYIMSFILLKAGYHRVGSFSAGKLQGLADALRRHDWQKVAQLFAEIYRK